MPGGDKTGPRGDGAMTGRGMGVCAGYDSPGFMNPGVNPKAKDDSGMGRGMGRGNRWRNFANGQGRMRGNFRGNNFARPAGYVPVNSEPEDINQLKAQAIKLEQSLKALNQKIENLSRTANSQE